MIYFSAPMPYEIDKINFLLGFNQKLKKTMITSLYFSLPANCPLFTTFEQYRNDAFKYSSWDYWKHLIEHSLKNDIDCIYLLNNPSKLPIENTQVLGEKLNKLDNLLNELRKIGINKLRVAEHKLISHISKNYPDFQIYASTSLEIKTILEYKNFVFMHPNIKQIVPSHDTIKNFKFLKNIKNLFPNIQIELMTNEGCIHGCPNRIYHSSEYMDRNIKFNNDFNFSNSYFLNKFCGKLLNEDLFKSLILSNVIYPWEIKEYLKIGINHFKFVGRDSYSDKNDYKILNNFYLYLKGIDDLNNIKKEPINKFIHHLHYYSHLELLTIQNIKGILPNINYFKKYGHLCASRCGVECRYCYKCAEKIQKVFMKKQEEQRKRNIPVCYFK